MRMQCKHHGSGQQESFGRRSTSLLSMTIGILSLAYTFCSSVSVAKADDQSVCSRMAHRIEGVYAIPTGLLSSIALNETGHRIEKGASRVAWPWTINVEGKGYYFKSKKEAIAKIRYFQSKGVRSIDVGCMQVNLKYHPKAFDGLEEALDPEANLAYAAFLLHEHYMKSREWIEAVAAYHVGSVSKSGVSERGVKYAMKVLTIWAPQTLPFSSEGNDVAEERVVDTLASL